MRNLREMNMKKRLIILLMIVVGLMSPNLLSATSYYYYEPFDDATTVSNNGWEWNFRMARDMVAYDIYEGSDQNHPGDVIITNGYLQIFGRPNRGMLAWNNWYIGDGAKWSPTNGSPLGSDPIDSSPEEPFGFQIIRYTTSIDPHSDPGGYAANMNQRAYATVWMASDNGAGAPYTRFDDFMYFYDKQVRANNNTWGYFKNYDNDIDIASIGASYDFDGVDPGSLETLFEKEYDDNDVGWDNTPFYSGDGYSNPVVDELGIKITHDGEKISIYVNPDPFNDSPGISDTWLLLTEESAGWNENLITFLGTETPFFRAEQTEAQYDHFLVRSIASNITAVVTPQKAVINDTVRFSVKLTPEIHVNTDSGIGEVYIKKPSGYGSWNLNNVNVKTVHITDTNNRITGGTPGDGEFLVTEYDSDTLHIRFYMASQTLNDIVTNGDVTVDFTLTTPSSANRQGSDFEVYADCTKHHDTGTDWIVNHTTGIKYATTGKMKAHPVSAESLKVRTYTQPLASAKVEYSPDPLTIGNAEASFTVKITTPLLVSASAPDISKLRIAVPSGFTISNNTVSFNNIESALLGPDLSYSNIFVSNNYVYVHYTRTNAGGFSGVNGFDKIQFTVNGTPTGFPGFYKDYVWTVEANSEEIVAGTDWRIATNGAPNISNQMVRVTISNAQCLAYIYPEQTAIFSVLANNENQYEYHIRNVGPVGNDIVRAKIEVPGDFTSLTLHSNDVVGATMAYSNQYIWITYSSDLTSGQQDTVYFSATHSNTNVFMSAKTVDFMLYADNDNSAGYKLQMEDTPRLWSVMITPPNPSGENYLAPVNLYTTYITNIITNTIYNKAPKGVSVKLAMIAINDSLFTNILDISSSHLADQGNIDISNENGTNFVLIRYDDDGNDLDSVYDNPSSPDKDEVVLTLVDAINYGTFSTLPKAVNMPTYVFKSAYVTNHSDYYALSDPYEGAYTYTNKIYVKHPEVDVEFSLSPNLVDSTTITNTFTFLLNNLGDEGNRISNIYIPIPPDVSTNIYSISASGSSSRGFNASQNRIEIIYGTPLDGGESTAISFDMVDHVDGMDKENIFIYPDVKNDWGWKISVTNIISNKSGKVDFKLPKPNGGGWVSPNVFYVNINEPVGSVITQDFVINITNLGSGTDRFDEINVLFPIPLQGMIVHLYSDRLGVTEASGVVTLNDTNLIINYSNAGNQITTGQGDSITVTAYLENILTLPQSGNWAFLANNGFIDWGDVPPRKYFDLTNTDYGSATAKGTERVTVNLVGNSLTTETTTSFDYQIINGTNGSLTIDKVKIKIPTTYSVASTNIIVTETTASYAVSNGYIVLDYPNGGELDAGERSVLKITAQKPILSEPTNFQWKCWVYYTNNYNNITNATKGNNIQIIGAPTSTFYAFVDQNTVGKDSDSGIFTLTVTNYGELGNNLYRVKIVPPTTNGNPKLVITNVYSIVSEIGGDAVYSNDGNVYVDYDSAGTNIPSGNADRISLVAVDNQANEGYTASWAVYGANLKSMNPTIESLDPIDIGESLEYSIVIPEYNSTYYILPNSLSSVEDESEISLYVNNIGTGNNNIRSLRLFIGYPFITNDVAVSTVLSNTGVSVGSINGSNYVQVDYPSDLFIPLSNDTVTLNVKDNFTFGDTNTQLPLYIKYNTSGVVYVPSDLSGGTNNIEFQMPAPDVVCQIEVQDVYLSQTNADINLMFINSGKGSNKAQRILLYIPAIYTNGLSLAGIKDPLATNVSLSNGTFTLLYTNFNVGVTNRIQLKLIDTITNLTNLTIESLVYNGIRETNSISVNNSKKINIVKAPSAEIITTEIYSTYYENEVQLNINNNTSGSSAIKYARIVVPPIFTNIVDVESTLGNIVSNDNSNVIVYYPSGLTKGTMDTLIFTIEDSKDLYETNGIRWSVFANNSTGYGTVRELFTGDLSLNMRIPAPKMTNNLLTKWYTIKTANDVPVNKFVMVLSNSGRDANAVISNRIILPNELSTISNGTLGMSYSGGTIVRNGTLISISYTDGLGFMPGETNTISFVFTNLVYQPANKNIAVYSYNAGDEYISSSHTITFKSPQEPTESYVDSGDNGHTIFYSIDHAATFDYILNNGMYDVGIRKVKINFNNANLKITNIYSSVYGDNLVYPVHYTTNATNIIIDYTYIGGLPSKLDEGEGREILTFAVVYTNSVNWTNDMSAKVIYDETIEYADVETPSGEWDYIPVLVADFGRIWGYALPGSAEPTITFYYPGTHNIVSNQSKGISQINGSADSSGYFLIDFIPGGTYNVGFSGINYSEFIVSNIVVTENIVSYIGTNKMRRQAFDPAAGYQVSLCLDDLSTSLIIPSGGVLPNYFSVNIWITNMSDEQAQLNSDGPIQIPDNPGVMKLYYFDIKNRTGEPKVEQELNGDVIIQLHYDREEIYNKGWNEDNLAIYYWRESTDEWVRVGGTVDKEAQLVVAQVSYLHREYAIFCETDLGEIVSGFESVSVNPKVFTPDSDDPQFSNMKINIGFSKSMDSYDFKVYNISGQLIREFSRSGGSYTQAEIHWDGKDSDGVLVKTGMYVYRIVTGSGEVFSGTLIVVR